MAILCSKTRKRLQVAKWKITIFTGYLVGALEHFVFSIYLGISSSQRTFGMAQPPTSYKMEPSDCGNGGLR